MLHLLHVFEDALWYHVYSAVKKQTCSMCKYLTIIIDTSICPITGQSTTMVKVVWSYVWYGRYCLYLLKYIDRLLISSEPSKVKESSLHAIWNAHTVFLLCGAVFSKWDTVFSSLIMVHLKSMQSYIAKSNKSLFHVS